MKKNKRRSASAFRGGNRYSRKKDRSVSYSDASSVSRQNSPVSKNKKKSALVKRKFIGDEFNKMQAVK